MSKQAQELTVTMLGIDTIQAHPENPRVGDVASLAESLERFGQMKPILVQKNTGFVIAGNHTREAAKTLGWEEIAAIILDVDDETAKAYLLADNRLADRGEYDADKLFALLSGELDLDGTGYDMDYVDTLADQVGANTLTGLETGAVTKYVEPGQEKAENIKPRSEAKTPAKDRTEPMRDVVMLMTVSKAQEFGQQVQALQKLWSTKTVVDTVQRAVAEALEGAKS